MELDKQKTGKPTKDKYTTSKEGIGHMFATNSYEEIKGDVCDVASEPCNNPKNVKTPIGGGKKLGIPIMGSSRG